MGESKNGFELRCVALGFDIAGTRLRRQFRLDELRQVVEMLQYQGALTLHGFNFFLGLLLHHSPSPVGMKCGIFLHGLL